MVIADFLQILIGCMAGMVAVCGHPVLSVFYLVSTFFRCSVLRVFYGTEFLGLMLVIIYMGAIAVLFLFVVMMLEMKVYGSGSDYSGYVAPYSFMIYLTVLASWLYDSVSSSADVAELPAIVTGGFGESLMSTTFDNLNGSAVLASILYTHYWHIYLVAGIVLLVALIGASVLTRDTEEFNV